VLPVYITSCHRRWTMGAGGGGSCCPCTSHSSPSCVGRWGGGLACVRFLCAIVRAPAHTHTRTHTPHPRAAQSAAMLLYSFFCGRKGQGGLLTPRPPQPGLARLSDDGGGAAARLLQRQQLLQPAYPSSSSAPSAASAGGRIHAPFSALCGGSIQQQGDGDPEAMPGGRQRQGCGVPARRRPCVRCSDGARTGSSGGSEAPRLRSQRGLTEPRQLNEGCQCCPPGRT